MKTRNANIFIVEDDNFFASMVKELLRKNDYQNVHVYNSGEACLENIHKAPDVVILDHKLGKLCGLEVLRKIKSLNPNIPVIFLSAQEKMTVAINSLKYGAYDYLDKTDDGLQRLTFLVKRALYTSNLALENRQFKAMRKWMVLAFVTFISTLIYLNWSHPHWFE